ncbi:UDP-2,4-diacetamido-2,4,6-trideoxy-beta-L-altropyranose hydrolase [Vibrio sp. E150_011]
MKVVFRVDASLLIGSGHVMRCLVLADQLKLKGHEVLFACSPLEGDMRPFIQERGFDVATLPMPQKIITPKYDADYGAWLQKSVDQDAEDFIETVTCSDLVITDHYAIGEQWQRQIRKSLDCRLFAIDDLARIHDADIILDQTLGRSESDYEGSCTNVLLGCEYAMLQPAFSRKRTLALSRKCAGTIPQVLVSMGGVDAPNATLKVLESLSQKVDAQFTVLLSSRAPHYKEVTQWCAIQSNVVHLDFVSDMAGLMLEHDIAIGAPGTTSWERACLGLPNIVIPLADNQRLICEQLVRYDASISVEIKDISWKLIDAYRDVLERWMTFKQANLAICDGLGVNRVVEKIIELENESNNLM